jgi:menaquinone-dependent protoporphyrinogen oxidase
MIGGALRREGVPTRVRPAGTVRSVGGYDAVIVGGALYHGRWHRAARRFVRRHRTALRSMPVWFFSSRPLGDDEQNPHIPPVGQVRRLMRRVGTQPSAGAWSRTRPPWPLGSCLTPGWAIGAIPTRWRGGWPAL